MIAAVVVSLDFELRWGVEDVLGEDASRCRENLLGAREAIPLLLEAFAARGVRATWAIVGALACESWDEWEARVPRQPVYTNPSLRWKDGYRRLDPSGRLHFAPELVEAIRRTYGQELGSHTFMHILCREPGIERDDVVADTAAVTKLFRDRWNEVPRSVVFPRNQVGHADVFRSAGVRTWRNNPRAFYWDATTDVEQSPLVRGLRLADSIFGLRRHVAPTCEARASHFVRLNLPEPLFRAHRRRIARDARRLRDGDALHLWCHPHNFGDDPRRRVARFVEILDAARDAAPAWAKFASMSDCIDDHGADPTVRDAA